MNGLFITGTDTDVGKTALSALLLAELRRRNINAAPMKPAQTGCSIAVAGTRQMALGKSEHSSLVASASFLLAPDLDYSLSMANLAVDPETYELMAPYRFEPACSPHLAAEMAGTEIEPARMLKAAGKLQADFDFVIAEGAGGILVPLNRRATMLDLMKSLSLPVLIAARPGLGTINHTLLSIRTLKNEGLKIAGVVFVASTDQAFTFIEEDNGSAIELFGGVPILGTIPYCPQLALPNPEYDALPISVVAETEKIVNQLTL